jgi:hypothetical protein
MALSSNEGRTGTLAKDVFCVFRWDTVASHGTLFFAHMVDLGNRVGVGAMELSYGFRPERTLGRGNAYQPWGEGGREDRRLGPGRLRRRPPVLVCWTPHGAIFERLRRHIPQIPIQGISGPVLVKWRAVAFQSFPGQLCQCAPLRQQLPLP